MEKETPVDSPPELEEAIELIRQVQRKFVHPYLPYTQRRATIVELRARGWTLEQVAKEVGITRERVHQILRQEGLIPPGKPGRKRPTKEPVA